MPKQIYSEIYESLKMKIESFSDGYTDMLPSEHTLTRIYDCSRNTVRRAIQMLIDRGYVQAVRGKGVQIIYCPVDPTNFSIGGIESFQELAERTGKEPGTRILWFEEIVADQQLAEKTGFVPGSLVYLIKRLRCLNGKPSILDINLFLKSETGVLTPQIAEHSIYQYLETKVGMRITISRRRITAEKATAEDMEHLQLKKDGFDFVSVITGRVFNANGVEFEWTQSRHRPDDFCFFNTAVRRRKEKNVSAVLNDHDLTN